MYIIEILWISIDRRHPQSGYPQSHWIIIIIVNFFIERQWQT